MFLWISGFLKGNDEDDALKYELTVGLEFESAVLAAMGWKTLGKSPDGEWLLTPDQAQKIGMAVNQQLPPELDLFIGTREVTSPMSLIYQNPSLSQDEVLRLLANGATANVVAALTSIGLNEVDRVWAQDVCLKHLLNGTEAIVASAVIALGHISRRHGELDTDKVLQALEITKGKFPSLIGSIEDTLDDIGAFTAENPPE